MCKPSYKKFSCEISFPEKEPILFSENWMVRESKLLKKYGSPDLALGKESKVYPSNSEVKKD